VIRLLRPDAALLDAAIEGDDALERALGHAVVPGWATFTNALVRARDTFATTPDGTDWGTRLFVSADPPELVGWGGFKGPPQDGVVEIGYEIAAGRQGRGLATEAVRAMVAEAFADEGVTAVIAQTMPERNASNRVLAKAGFRFEGDATDDEGATWRFALARPSQGD